MRQISYINKIVKAVPFKEVLFYFIIASSLVFTAISFTNAYRALLLYKEFTNRNTVLYQGFKNLSSQVNDAAVLNPDLVRSGVYSKGVKLFNTDSISIIKQLDVLNATAHDAASIGIMGKLDTKIRAELSWLLKSNVPDSIVHHRSPKHIAEFQIINILLDQGTERTIFLSKQHDKGLNDAIKSIETWLVVFIVISGLLLLYAGFNVFSQKAKSEKRFRLLVENSDGIISLLDKNLFPFYRSPSAERITGYKSGYKVGAIKIDEIHPDDKAKITGCLAEIQANPGKAVFVTYRLKHKEGHYIWLEGTFTNMLQEPGINAIVCNFMHVTDKKRAEAILQQTVQEFSAYKYALDEAAIVVLTDQKGTILHVNDNFCKISKYGKGDLIGQDHRIINSKYHPKEFIRNLWATIASGKIWRGELKNKAKDGTFYWVDTTIVPFLDEHGKPYQYIAIQADITERKRGEQSIIANIELAVQNAEKEKRAVELIIANKELAVQNAEKEKRAVELIIANRELAFQNAEKEKRAKELIVANVELAFQNEEKEKRAGELMVANVELAFQNEEKEKRAGELMVANVELAFQNEEKGKRAGELILANVELAFQNEEKEKRAGELMVANVELAFQNEEKGKRAGELILANVELAFQNEEKEKRAEELIIANRELKKAEDDIRKLNKEDIRKLNEELEQKVVARTAQLESANQELESFSYSVSHDLRTPLRAVNGYAKLLEEDYAGLFDSEGRRMLAVVQNNAKKMGVLIDDLLTFSRLGKKEVKKSLVNMSALVENALAELHISQQFKAFVTINDLHPAIADTTLMAQVWVNLLSNAIKYSSKNKKPAIKIDSEKKDNQLIYSISDNGVGFDMKYAHKLFGVFQRLHSSNEFEGTGVGLALVHRIITKQGGKIWGKAEVNKGATFYFSLPEKAIN